MKSTGATGPGGSGRKRVESNKTSSLGKRGVSKSDGATSPTAKRSIKQGITWLNKLRGFFFNLSARTASWLKTPVKAFTRKDAGFKDMLANIRTLANSRENAKAKGKGIPSLELQKLSTEELLRISENIVSAKEKGIEILFNKLLESPELTIGSAARENFQENKDVFEEMETGVNELLAERIPDFKEPDVRNDATLQDSQLQGLINGYMDYGTELNLAASRTETSEAVKELSKKSVELNVFLEHMISMAEARHESRTEGLENPLLGIENLSENEARFLLGNIRKAREEGIDKLYKELILEPDFGLGSKAQNMLIDHTDILRELENAVLEKLHIEERAASLATISDPKNHHPDLKSFINHMRRLCTKINVQPTKAMVFENSGRISPEILESLGTILNNPTKNEQSSVKVLLPGTTDTCEITYQYLKDLTRNIMYLDELGEPGTRTVLASNDPKIKDSDPKPDLGGPNADAYETLNETGQEWVGRKILKLAEFCGYKAGGDVETNRQALEKVHAISLAMHQRVDGALYEATNENPDTEMSINGKTFPLIPIQGIDEKGHYILRKDSDGNISVVVERVRHSMQIPMYSIAGINRSDSTLMQGVETNFASVTIQANLSRDNKWILDEANSVYAFHIEVPAVSDLE